MDDIWYQYVQKKNSEYFPGQSSKYFSVFYTFSNYFCCPFDSIKVKYTVLPQGGSTRLQRKPQIFCLHKQLKQGILKALQIATARVYYTEKTRKGTDPV